MARCCLLPKDSFHSIAPSIMALPQEEMVPQSQLVLCTAIEEIPRPSRHLSEPEDHLFNLPCSKQVSAIHRDALQEVNKAVCQVLARTIPCKRGSYKSKALDPAQRCEIGKCASEHGISTAQKKFGVPRTTVWKSAKQVTYWHTNSSTNAPRIVGLPLFCLSSFTIGNSRTEFSFSFSFKLSVGLQTFFARCVFHVRKRTYQFHIAVQDLVLYSYKIPLSSTCQNLADCPVYSTFAINKHEL